MTRRNSNGGRPEHRQYLREMLPKNPLTPTNGIRHFDAKVAAYLFLSGGIAPIIVLFLLAVYAPNWTVIASAGTQIAGALLVFRYIYKNTPKSHNIFQLSKNMRNAFIKKFDENLEVEDLQDVIGELDQPALTGWQSLADFFISHSPFKWSTLLFLAAFGANIIPLLDTNAKPEDVNVIRLPAALLGLAFGLLELTRFLDRLLNNKRLEAAREWLRQIQQNVFPESQEDSA